MHAPIEITKLTVISVILVLPPMCACVRVGVYDIMQERHGKPTSQHHNACTHRNSCRAGYISTPLWIQFTSTMLRFTLSSLVSRRNKIYQPLLRIRLSLFHASSSWENSRRQNCVAASVSQDGKKVNLYSTKEGKAVDKKSLHVLWLRHRCHCSNCHSKHSGQTIVDPMLLTKDLRVQSAHVQGI